MNGPLHGIEVLDLTAMLAGPFATMLLADRGADVVKVEPPGGDTTRSVGPFLEDEEPGLGGYFQSVNRGKRSIVLDLRSDAGHTRFLELVAIADVVVENFSTGVMDRLQLPYEVLADHNPRLVYAAIRGFGDPRTGRSPYVDWLAFDVVAQAMGGYLSVTGTPDGTPIEGNSHPLLCPFDILQSADGWIAVAAPSDRHWRIIAEAIGQPEMATDERFATNSARADHREEALAPLEAWIQDRTNEQVVDELGGIVPIGPVNDVADVFADPHVRARNMPVEIEEPPSSRTVTVAGQPIKFSRTPSDPDRRVAATRGARPRGGPQRLVRCRLTTAPGGQLLGILSNSRLKIIRSCIWLVPSKIVVSRAPRHGRLCTPQRVPSG